MYYGVNTETLKVFAKCETVEQCTLWADRKCKGANFIVIDGNYTGYPPEVMKSLQQQGARMELNATIKGTVQTPVTAPPAVEKKQVRSGTSVKATVFALMDDLWIEAGKPADVAALRIQLMNSMGTTHPEIKRVTISTTLGNWVKNRLHV